MRDVVVVGGGLTGLACGHALRRGGADVVVLEASTRPGGVVGTLEVDGFRFETGPNTVQAGSAEFRHLCDELGLAERLTVSKDDARTRWLYFRGRLRAMPDGPRSLLTTDLLSLGAKLRLCTEPLRRFRPPAAGAPEPTFAQVLDERLGPEPTALFAGAFVRGIYAGDHRRLGARSAFPRLWRMLVEHGGIVRGLRASRRRAPAPLPGPQVSAMRLLSLPGGLGELIDAAAADLGGALQLGFAAASVERDAEGWRVQAADGRSESARQIVLALPADCTATLLAPHLAAADLAFLEQLPHSSVRLAHLGFAPGALDLPRGFGYLVPPSEDGPDAPRTLGTIFVSNLFADRAPAGGAAISSFYALDQTRDLSDEELSDLARADLARALGLAVAPRPAVARSVTWPHAIPQYEPEHDRRVRDLEERVGVAAPGLHLAGSYTRGVSVEQVVARGRGIARALLAADGRTNP
ncbi:protoporphyrinogen oxidase [Engelhardtia mirabilis]|uniref:Coproporphyrinogen III oxidase n=1 Tax=Engelhardtia mirabilis TaxID=2528011 RepID=A0A518BSV3_9BACT|nr:Protoporphyrinogen oxidase [Planctomycetes bacterium Pla133]QDV04374.1 Protoporphyrinogen oxidase [Planctomycetes bacterium Pla86]